MNIYKSRSKVVVEKEVQEKYKWKMNMEVHVDVSEGEAEGCATCTWVPTCIQIIVPTSIAEGE